MEWIKALMGEPDSCFWLKRPFDHQAMFHLLFYQQTLAVADLISLISQRNSLPILKTHRLQLPNTAWPLQGDHVMKGPTFSFC